MLSSFFFCVLAKKKFDLSRDFPHLSLLQLLLHPLGARCSVPHLIGLRQTTLSASALLLSFHCSVFFFFSFSFLYRSISFTLPCGKVCRVTWRRHSWIEQEQEQEQQHPSWDSALVWATGWQQTTLVLVFSLSFSLCLSEWNWIKIYIFNHLCSCFNLSLPVSLTHLFLSLSRSVSDSFAHSHLISVKSANYSPLLYGGASTCRPNWLKINNNYYAIYIYMVCMYIS